MATFEGPRATEPLTSCGDRTSVASPSRNPLEEQTNRARIDAAGVSKPEGHGAEDDDGWQPLPVWFSEDAEPFSATCKRHAARARVNGGDHGCGSARRGARRAWRSPSRARADESSPARARVRANARTLALESPEGLPARLERVAAFVSRLGALVGAHDDAARRRGPAPEPLGAPACEFVAGESLGPRPPARRRRAAAARARAPCCCRAERAPRSTRTPCGATRRARAAAPARAADGRRGGVAAQARGGDGLRARRAGRRRRRRLAGARGRRRPPLLEEIVDDGEPMYAPAAPGVRAARAACDAARAAANGGTVEVHVILALTCGGHDGGAGGAAAALRLDGVAFAPDAAVAMSAPPSAEPAAGGWVTHCTKIAVSPPPHAPGGLAALLPGAMYSQEVGAAEA